MGQASLIYGESLHGKSTFLASALVYGLQKDPNLVARLITCENYEVLEPFIDAGVLEVWPIDNRDYPFDSLNAASLGFWPEDPLDPNSPLIDPTPESFQKHWMRFWEGLATFGDFLMGGYAKGGLAARSGRGEKIGPSEETVQFTDGAGGKGLKVGGNPRTHYNVVQRFLHGLVNKGKALPGHSIFTAHEIVAKDDRSNQLIVGPELVGSAATSRSTRWFGNVFHMVRVDEKDKKTGLLKSEYRIYLRPHYTEEIKAYPHKAVMRVPALVQDEADKLIPEYLISKADTYEKIMLLRGELDGLSKKAVERARGGK